MTALWVSALTIMLLARFALGNRASLGGIIGVAAYAAGINAIRLGGFLLSKLGAEKVVRKVIKPMPQSVLDISTTYKLAPMEIVPGFNGKTPIRVDFSAHHTLIVGVTGFGKTFMLVSILIQLFSKGARFTDYCDVYLFDYKADGDDWLHLWKGLVKGYYSIAENSADEAIEEILHLANSINDGPKKRILVIIDEVASISIAKKAEANDALALLAAKLRSRGTLIVATQYPRYDIIPRSVTANMSRKISLHVDDMDQAKLVFRTRPPESMLPIEQGEFLLKEPGRPGFTFGVGIEPRLPQDVQAAIQIAAPQDHDDPRVKFLIDTITGLSKGDSILGINKRVTEARRVGTDLKQKFVSEHYKLYENANIFSKPQRGGTRRLMCSSVEAVGLLEEHIDTNM